MPTKGNPGGPGTGNPYHDTETGQFTTGAFLSDDDEDDLPPPKYRDVEEANKKLREEEEELKQQAIERIKSLGFKYEEPNELPKSAVEHMELLNPDKPAHLDKMHAIMVEEFVNAAEDTKGTRLHEMINHADEMTVVFGELKPDIGMATTTGYSPERNEKMALFTINTNNDPVEFIKSSDLGWSVATDVGKKILDKTGDKELAVRAMARGAAIHEFAHMLDMGTGEALSDTFISTLQDAGVMPKTADDVGKFTKFQKWLDKNISEYASAGGPSEAVAEATLRYVATGKKGLPKELTKWGHDAIGTLGETDAVRAGSTALTDRRQLKAGKGHRPITDFYTMAFSETK